MSIIEEAEKKTVVRLAINFLKSGINDQVVADNTGLSLKEIHQLKSQHGLA